MPGPPPNPNARRRNVQPEWVSLPADGRVGLPPDWPLGRSSKAIDELWSQLWSTPQAVAWDGLGWNRVVARYTKLLLAAEKSDATAAMLGEVRQLEDRLGLTPMAMRRLRWLVSEPSIVNEEPAGVSRLDDYRELYGG